MPLQATSGAASYDAFGGGVPVVPNYIEDVFSTWLYTGNGSTQTINNGIDLAGKGGMVWIKGRSAETVHTLVDSARGVNKTIYLPLTVGQDTSNPNRDVSAFNSNGFSLGPDFNAPVNTNATTFASWTFREQPKFFDVVTYTGNGTAGRQIAHNLGAEPGCIIVKATNSARSWMVYHRSTGATQYLLLERTDAASPWSGAWNNTAPTSTNFTVGTAQETNGIGNEYVAYLFAHNAGGFGLTGTDNVISCGSFTTDGSGNATVNLGYEPQWVFVKASSTTSDWYLLDTMRGMSNANPAENARLYANTSGAETSTGGTSGIVPTATGFNHLGYIAANATFIYIAIRRGPMAVPTTGTSVFTPLALNNTTGTKNTTNFPVDFQFSVERNGVHNTFVVDRLRGVITTAADAASPNLKTNSTAAEASDVTGLTRYWDNTGFQTGSYQDSAPTAYWNFRRAPGFFDEVCYTGDGAASRNITHNLTVTPELIFAKSRSNTANWVAYNAFGNGLILNSAAAANSGFNFITSATASTFTPADPASFGGSPNQSGQTYVAYLFASCPGVSKVGSYTGTGTTQTINCGFTGGARFVLIKRTDSAGDWFVWDTARGIVSGNDPYLLLNSTAAEVTNTDYIDTYSAGFEISSTAPAAINASGGSYIFLAIA